jgi:putative ABC transport system permease protein
MNFLLLVLKEALHRKANFVLALLSVVLAVGSLVGAFTLLKVHDKKTDEIIAAKEAETKVKMRVLEDDYRKIMKKLGFNLLIIPKSQNLSDIYAEDYLDKTMPEEYTTILKKSTLEAILQHLIPILQKRVKWPEKERTIILAGVRGEVGGANKKESMFEPVHQGEMVLGYELHKSLGLKQGETVVLLGKSFKIAKLEAEKGTKDDITVWINLKEAQVLLAKPGRINGIMALECYCAEPIIEKIRGEISKILPDVQVIEFSSEVVTRAEARVRAAEAATDALEAEKIHRKVMRAEKENFAAVLVPLIIVASALWVGILMFTNVRERRHEIGILRAIGAVSLTIMSMFLLKAVLIGLIGSIIGYAAGMFTGVIIETTGGSALNYFDTKLFLLVVLLTPLVACLASFVPAVIAADQDPAEILSEE